MAQIKFVERLGKDLFQYMTLAVRDEERASEWAATNYVLIDGVPLSLEDYLKLNPKYRDKIIGSIFSMKTPDTYESDDNGVIYEDINGKVYEIAKRKVKHSLLMEIQTKFQETNQNRTKYVRAMKESLTIMFDLTLSEIDAFPYELVAGLVSDLNNFLQQSTKSESSFAVADDDLFAS